VGRLDEIIERNRHPRRSIRKRKGGLGVGLASIVLFGALVALIFTNLAQPPEDPPATPTPPEHRVRDVRLRPLHKPATGSGSAVGSGSSAGSGAPRR
jgi:hypothetical protein